MVLVRTWLLSYAKILSWFDISIFFEVYDDGFFFVEVLTFVGSLRVTFWVPQNHIQPWIFLVVFLWFWWEYMDLLVPLSFNNKFVFILDREFYTIKRKVAKLFLGIKVSVSQISLQKGLEASKYIFSEIRLSNGPYIWFNLNFLFRCNGLLLVFPLDPSIKAF